MITATQLTRSQIRSNLHLNLRGAVLPPALEKGLRDFYEKCKVGDPILLDFADAEFVDIATLSNLISIFSDRCERKLKTVIGLPKKKDVRDFLRIWRFPEALEEVSNTAFRNLVVADDHGYFGERQTTYSELGEGVRKLEWNPDWDTASSTRRNFFEFTTYKKSPTKIRSFAGKISEECPRDESKQWNKPLIQAILAKHFGVSSPKSDVARVIIYEAMSNAVRHPDASVIQAVSKFYLLPKPKLKDFGLQLLLDLSETNHLPEKGKKLVIVARVKNKLYFRVFDARGKRVVDKSEDQITSAISDILKKLKDDLEGILLNSLDSNKELEILKIVDEITDFTRKKSKNSWGETSGVLRICIWDDGESIADTLDDVLKKGGKIREYTPFPAYLSDSIYCQYKNFGDDKWNPQPIVLDENIDVNKVKHQTGSLLLFSLLPGVSRTFNEDVPAVEPLDGDGGKTPVRQSPFYDRGMGLYALRRLVINHFRGEISLRSGSHFLRVRPSYEAIRKKHPSAAYWAKMITYPDSMPKFKGNLLIINLPIRD